MLHVKFDSEWPSGFKEEDVWTLWTDDNDNNDDGRRSMGIL